MPRVDFLPEYSGSYTRHFRGTSLYVRYTCTELWLLLFCIINVLLQTGLGLPLLLASSGAVSGNLYASGTFVGNASEARSFDPPVAFDAVVLFLCLFGAWYAVSGVLMEREHDIFLHLACSALASAHAGVECFFSAETLLRVRAGFCASVTAACVVLAVKSVRHPVWSEFLIVGVSRGMIEMYRKFCRFLMLLKLEFVSTVVFGILTLDGGAERGPWQLATPGLVALYGLLLWLLGSVGVRKEKTWCVYGYVALSMVAPLLLPLELALGQEPVETRALAVQLGAGTVCIGTRIYVHTQLLGAFQNFRQGLADEAFLGLLTPEATGLISGRRR